MALLTLVDDFGQYEGRSSIIWSDCFTVWNELHPKEQVDHAACCSALQQLSDASMIEIYQGNNGKRYLQVTQWEERIRSGCRPKWIEQKVEYCKLLQVAASCSKLLPPTPSSPPSSPPTPSPSVNGNRSDGIVLRAKISIGSKFKRSPDFRWSYGEESVLCELARRPDFENELRQIICAYEKKTPFMSETIFNLLRDWTANVDRANSTVSDRRAQVENVI